MLKKTITYENYNGDTVKEDFYFNLNESELVELELSAGEGGFTAQLQKIITSNDNWEIVKTFQKIILMAYGKKSDDGRRFQKSEEIRQEFTDTQAYSELFMELATDADSATAFIRGLMPAKLMDRVKSLENQEVVELPEPKPDAPLTANDMSQKDLENLPHEELLRLAAQARTQGL